MRTKTRAHDRAVGKERGVMFVVVLATATLGFYSIYWAYKTFAEVRRYRRQGVGGLAGALLLFVVVSQFLLPAYVGRMYREDDWEDPPVDGWSGLIALVPYIGGIIWLAKLQSALNGFWEKTMPGTAHPF